MKLFTGLAAVALATTTLVSTPPALAASIQADPGRSRAVEAGTRWLTSQLTNGLVHNDHHDFDDHGLSADVAFALLAVGEQAAAGGVVDAIEPTAESWVTGGPGRVYAGSLAKLVSVAQATGKDATAFNGTDQVDRLEDHVSTTVPRVGRLEDSGVDPNVSWDADFVNVIGQSFASRALTAAGSDLADEATGFLLAQQCNEGFFRATLTADETSDAQGCDSKVHRGSVDTTALAVINILATPGASTRAKGAAALGASWLRSQQAPDGSFSAGGTEGYNANSTGLAGWALAEAGDRTAAARAAAWLQDVQVADLAPCATTLSADNGAIAYQPSVLAAARTAGIKPAQRDQYRRATAQALPALASLPASSTLGIAAPAGAVEKTSVAAVVSGLSVGERACASLGSQHRPVVGTGSDLRVSFQLPAGAATYTARVATLGGAVNAITKVTTAPVPVPAAPLLGQLDVSRVEKVRNGNLRLAVDCDEAQACRGTLAIRTRREVRLPSGRTRRLVARVRYDAPAGTSERIVVHLPREVRRVLRRTPRLSVVAKQHVRGADTVRTRFWLERA